MADKENCVRITRGMKRKAVAAGMESAPLPPPPPPPRKKRVALGEISNSSSVLGERQVEVEAKSKKRKSGKGVKKALVLVEEEGGRVSWSKAGVRDESAAKRDDLRMCAAYVSDIYDYLKDMEVRQALPDYLEKVQKDLSANMRGILVDWLVEVSEEYKSLPDTLHLAISYVDRYLSLHAVSRTQLQLLGVASMLIASKYEEIRPPNVDDFCYIADYTYNKQQVVKMEADVLKSLDFEISRPTTKTFLRIFTTFVQAKLKAPNLQFEFLGCYLAELSLLDYGCLKFLPSLVAASVIFLARFTIWPMAHPWCLELQENTGYRPSELKTCVHIVQGLQLSKAGASLVAIREKYNQHNFKLVASLTSFPKIPDSYFEDLEK
uniref:Uncharacterized protein n=1 Tax=Kalanchoe fedtschenkoi TaxID=63787 RepID=A0A7N0TIS9_KALFE